MAGRRLRSGEALKYRRSRVELKDRAALDAAGIGDTYLPSAYSPAPYDPARSGRRS